MDMHAAELGIGAGRLYRDEQAFRVERAFKALLLLQVALIEHRPHQIAFFDANAMFAGQNTADFNTSNVSAEFFRLLKLTRIVGVIEDQWMQIAVSSVKTFATRNP